MFSGAEIAVPIPLAVWQDPQGNLTLNHTDGLCEVLFDCWDESGEPADYSCSIKFQQAWAVRGVCMESTPYKYKEHLRSCIYEIENSLWLDELSKMRVAYYPEWKDWDKRIYKHFLVTGHDNYYEIIATGFDEEKTFP